MSAPTINRVAHPSWCDESACRSLPNGDNLPPTVMHTGQSSRLALGDYELRTCLAKDSDPIDGDAEYVGLVGTGPPDLALDWSMWLTLEQTQALVDRLQRLLDVAALKGGCAR